MKFRTVVLAGLFFLGGTALAQSAGRYYSNDRWGFRVRTPKGWKSAALSASEEWIVSKHLGPQKLEAKRSEFYEAGYPQMWIIGFPHGRQRGAKVSEGEGKTKVTFKNPFKDYKDLLKRRKDFMGGGYHFDAEAEAEIKGVRVSQYEIVVDKMVSAPYQVVTWVYHFDDIDFAIQFKILQGYYRKHKTAFVTCLKSFTRIARKRALPGSATTGDSIVSAEDEKNLTPEEKAKRRRQRFETTLAKESGALPDDWYVLRSKRYVVMANCSKKFAREVLNHAESIRTYLDKTFGGVGSDYVPPGIIRVFATRGEQEAYQQSTSTNWFEWAEQVVISEESKKAGRKSWAMEPVSAGVTNRWLSFKNRMLSENMPRWFSYGLNQHMRFARVKGKRVTIKPDDWDREQIKGIIKQGKAIAVRKLFEAGDSQQTYLMQCGSVLSYLLTAGSRGKTKNIVQRYMANLITAIEAAHKDFKKRNEKIDEEAKEDAAAGANREESEEESGEDEGDAHWEAFKKALKERRDAIRKNAFAKTFGALSDKDWDRLDKAWRKHAG